MKRKLIIIIFAAGISFFAGYELRDFKIADSKISILDDKSVCPYLKENSSINSENKCPYLNKGREAGSKCPYLEEKNQVEESKKKLSKEV